MVIGNINTRIVDLVLSFFACTIKYSSAFSFIFLCKYIINILDVLFLSFILSLFVSIFLVAINIYQWIYVCLSSYNPYLLIDLVFFLQVQSKHYSGLCLLVVSIFVDLCSYNQHILGDLNLSFFVCTIKILVYCFLQVQSKEFSGVFL